MTKLKIIYKSADNILLDCLQRKKKLFDLEALDHKRLKSLLMICFQLYPRVSDYNLLMDVCEQDLRQLTWISWNYLFVIYEKSIIF